MENLTLNFIKIRSTVLWLAKLIDACLQVLVAKPPKTNHLHEEIYLFAADFI